MRFEKEINIYGDEAVLKRFQANETSIAVVQGNISALISESELEELESSHATMYSKLASAVMDIESLTLNFSDLTTKYNAVSGQYSSLDSKVAQYKAGVDGLEADIIAVQQNLSQNYSTTTAMNAAITAKANEISAELSAVQTTLENDYSTTTAMNAAINAKANEISLSVSSQIAAINGDITQMSAAITTNAENISLKVDKGGVISEINQSSDTITLSSNRLVVNSTNFKLTSDGKVTANSFNSNNAKITGGSIKISDSNNEYYVNIAGGNINLNTKILSDTEYGGISISGSGTESLSAHLSSSVLSFANNDYTKQTEISYSQIKTNGSLTVGGATRIENSSFYTANVPQNGNRNDSNGMGQQGRACVTDLNHFVCFEWITYMGVNWLNGFVDVTSLGGVQFNQ